MAFRRARRWIVVASLAVVAVVTAALGAYELLGVVRVKVSPQSPYQVGSEDITLFPVGNDLSVLELHWKDASGKPYGSCAVLAEAIREQGKRPRLVMNAGIFGNAPEGIRPLGLHVENAQPMVPLNTTRNAYGNFYLEPNGVFWWDGATARIETTEAFQAAGRAPANAVQSGPMLLVDGVINSAFSTDSSNRRIRAGVGTTPQGEVLLGFARVPVTFHDFAEAFRRNGCDNALYLDGEIAALQLDDEGYNLKQNTAAAMLAVVERAR